MTTKRFKAVCTETGREFLPEHQGLQDGPDMRVSHLKKRKGKILHHWPLQVWVTAECTNRVELCQSTGLHDANGQEVFFGDFVKCLDEDEHCYFIDWDDKYCRFTPEHVIENIQEYKVIGNKWMPQFKK